MAGVSDESRESLTPSASAPPSPPPESERGGELLAGVSNAVVRILKDYWGKGPTAARSHVSGDVLVVILQGGFTRSEQTLLAHGHGDQVADSRAALQDSVEAELRSVVEQLTGRRVRSFMSANDPAAGYQAEIFVLEEASHLAGEGAILEERARRAREEHRELLEEHRALRAEQIQSRRGTPPQRRLDP